MQASRDNIKVNNVVLFNKDEYATGDVQEFHGQVLGLDNNGVHVAYLSGYQSRNDFVPWGAIFAKVDKRRTWIKLSNSEYNGNFLEFTVEDRLIPST